MIKVQFLDKYIEEQLIKRVEEERRNHASSGKLSASMLGQPIQWQILKVIGVPGDEMEEYVTRKFARGNDVEDWLVSQMPGIVNKQKFVEYKNTVGYVDALIDMRDWKLDFETLPHEIKSVSNAKYKRIQKTEPDKNHILQACVYALALGTDQFCIDYVASDDYRVETYMFDTKDRIDAEIDITIKEAVDKEIDAFYTQLKSGIVPAFQAIHDWQNDEKYANY